MGQSFLMFLLVLWLVMGIKKLDLIPLFTGNPSPEVKGPIRTQNELPSCYYRWSARRRGAHVKFALLQPELLSGGVMKRRCETPRVSVKHSHQTNFRQKNFQERELSGFSWALERHPNFTLMRKTKWGCQLLTVHRGALNPQCHLSSPSGEMKGLSKKYIQTLHLLQDVCTGLPLPCVSDPLCSHKCPARVTMKPTGRRRVEESLLVWVPLLGIKRYTQPLQLWPWVFLGAGGKGEEDWWRVPTAHIDIFLFPMISPLQHLTARRKVASKRDFTKLSKGRKKAAQSSVSLCLLLSPLFPPFPFRPPPSFL